MSNLNNITKKIDEEKENLLKDLENFIKIPSVSSDKTKIREAYEYILKLGEKLGFTAKKCADDQVALIEMGEGKETLGILAHIDVVPVAGQDEWKTDPFNPVIIDNKMYGRGTLDDKGMVIASLYAMYAVKSLGLPIKKKVQLILGTQEEVGDWNDMKTYVKNYPLPDYGFTPDGEYPLENIEKGICDFRLVFDSDKVNDGKVYVTSINCGSMVNSVPSKAIATLSDGKVVEAKGKSVHSSDPARGDNALYNLYDELIKSGVSENIFTKLLKEIKDKIGDHYGKKLSIYKESEYYDGEYVHRNTFAPTIFNTDEKGRIALTIDARFSYGTDEKEILDCFDKIAKNLGGKLEIISCQPAIFISKEKPFMKVFAKAYEDVTGLKNEFILAFGGSYAKAMPNIVSWGPIFPGEVDTCHEPNEFISIDSLLNSTKIFAESISNIALTEESFK